ncbi:MAG: hypothetical protein AAB490_03535 [Patescibacteria group bacterium]
MGKTGLTDVQFTQVVDHARAFIREAKGTAPCIASGNLVAHEFPERSKVRNFSTITRLATLADGMKIFMIYRYPRSWIHSVTDNLLARWPGGIPATKPFRLSTWKGIFKAKSRIEVYDLEPFVPVVAMPYIPNFNLWDVLQNDAGTIGWPAKMKALQDCCTQINEMHDVGTTWGQLIVHNIILHEQSLEPSVCDTEVQYWRRVPQMRMEMFDWFQFIFSAAGSYRDPSGNAAKTAKVQEEIARELVGYIKDTDVRSELLAYCRKWRLCGQLSLLQLICSAGFLGSIGCNVSNYGLIRRAIAAL